MLGTSSLGFNAFSGATFDDSGPIGDEKHNSISLDEKSVLDPKVERVIDHGSFYTNTNINESDCNKEQAKQRSMSSDPSIKTPHDIDDPNHPIMTSRRRIHSLPNYKQIPLQPHRFQFQLPTEFSVSVSGRPALLNALGLPVPGEPDPYQLWKAYHAQGSTCIYKSHPPPGCDNSASDSKNFKKDPSSLRNYSLLQRVNAVNTLENSMTRTGQNMLKIGVKKRFGDAIGISGDIGKRFTAVVDNPGAHVNKERLIMECGNAITTPRVERKIAEQYVGEENFDEANGWINASPLDDPRLHARDHYGRFITSCSGGRSAVR